MEGTGRLPALHERFKEQLLDPMFSAGANQANALIKAQLKDGLDRFKLEGKRVTDPDVTA